MYNAPILKKAIEILRLIVNENRPRSVTEVARDLVISKSTTFGILKSLEEEGFLFKDPVTKKYTAGDTLFELSKQVLGATNVAMTARPYLEQLLALVDETIFLGVREDDAAKVLDVLEPEKELKISSPIGTRFSILGGVIGKIFLSYLNDEEILEVISQKGLRRYTENSIVDAEEYLEEIRKIRAQGYAVDLEEYLKGMRAIASLIYSGDYPIAAVWVVGFTSSMSDDKLPQMILHLNSATQQISSSLSRFLLKKG
jgi:DNA-binding IclR family transcriptional regulator